jgi:hypothetical protein
MLLTEHVVTAETVYRKRVRTRHSRPSGLQPDDQFQAIENVRLDCEGLCCIRSKMLSFEQNGLGTRLPTTESQGRWRQSTRKEDRHICNDPLIKAI